MFTAEPFIPVTVTYLFKRNELTTRAKNRVKWDSKWDSKWNSKWSSRETSEMDVPWNLNAMNTRDSLDTLSVMSTIMDILECMKRKCTVGQVGLGLENDRLPAMSDRCRRY